MSDTLLYSIGIVSVILLLEKRTVVHLFPYIMSLDM